VIFQPSYTFILYDTGTVIGLMCNLLSRYEWVAVAGLSITAAVSSAWHPVCAWYFHWHASWTANTVLFMWSV